MKSISVGNIKKMLKNKNEYKRYKNLFLVKKYFFILTKVSLIFESSFSNEQLLEFEINIINDINNIETWGNQFKECSQSFLEPYNSCDWYSFGKFMFYVWNQQKFHKKKKSIYNFDNFNEINNLKTHEYNLWIKSLYELNKKEMNIFIRKVLKLL